MVFDDGTIRVDDRRENSRYEIAFFSGIGKRENQQDRAYCYVDDENVFGVVCDGMGGLTGGELASSTGVELAEVSFRSFLASPPENFHNADWMVDVIRAADHSVFLLKNENGEPLGAGSTFLSAWIDGDRLYWASAGDSRMFLFQNNEAVQVTTDLNYYYVLNRKLAGRRISLQKYEEESASGEHLISYLGIGNISIIDHSVEPFKLLKGDRILLCSDGLYRTVNLSMMQQIMGPGRTLEEAVKLFRQAIGIYNEIYQDNYTCIIIAMKE